MKSKKILIISIIAVIIVILILGGVTFAIAYTKTDMFKTDEQLFYKYFIEFAKNIEGLESKELEKYLEKTKSNSYESKGKLSVKVDIPELEKTKAINLKTVNAFNITFSGKTDKLNNLSEQNINLNYSDEVTFPIGYKQTEDLYGITSELILKQYIAIKNENLQELVKENENLGNTNIISENNINIQDIKNELPKYKEIILNNLNESNFSKVEEEFILTLNEKETAKILLEILEELEKSDFLPNEIKEKIKNQINEIKIKEYTEEESLKIVVNKSGKLLIKFEDKLTLNIQKIGNELIIEAVSEENKITLTIRKNRK